MSKVVFLAALTVEMAVCITGNALTLVEPCASDRINLFIIVTGH